MLLFRLLVIGAACLAASFAAGLVFAVAVLVPQLGDLGLGPIDGGAVAILSAFAAVFVSGLALLPAALVIAIAESLSIRAVLFYAGAGALLACFLYFSASNWQTLACTANGFARRELEIMAGAGVVAGFVYWAIAGRHAGAWRRRPYPQPDAR